MLRILTTVYGSRAWNLAHYPPSQSGNHIAFSGGAWKGGEPTPVDPSERAGHTLLLSQAIATRRQRQIQPSQDPPCSSRTVWDKMSQHNNGVGLDLYDDSRFTIARKLDLDAGWLLSVFDSDRCVVSFHGWSLFASFDLNRAWAVFTAGYSLPVSTGTAAWAVLTAGYTLSVSTGTAAWAVFTSGYPLPVSNGTAAWTVFTSGYPLPASIGTAAWTVFTAGYSLPISTRTALWDVFTTVTTADLKYEICPFKIHSFFCVPPALTFRSSVFCSQSVLMRFLQFS